MTRRHRILIYAAANTSKLEQRGMFKQEVRGCNSNYIPSRLPVRRNTVVLIRSVNKQTLPVDHVYGVTNENELR
jgi:hypothetical protein